MNNQNNTNRKRRNDMKKQETSKNNTKKAVNSEKAIPESKGKYLKERKPKKVVRERLRHDANVKRIELEFAHVDEQIKAWRRKVESSCGIDRMFGTVMVGALNAYGIVLCCLHQYESLKPRAKNGKPLHRTPEEIAEFERFVGLAYPNNKKERKA